MLNTSSRNSNPPFKAGITGGIGSGKSLACQIFRVFDVPVFEADTEAKRLMDSDPEVRARLMDLAGPEIYTPSGKLDRPGLARLIFNNNQLLREVNSVVHPAVRKAFFKWAADQQVPYVLMEAAILFESGFYRSMDVSILMTAPEELRIQRVMERDGASREQVVSRIRNQWPEEAKRELADFIITNDESTFLITQVLDVHNKLMEYGKIW